MSLLRKLSLCALCTLLPFSLLACSSSIASIPPATPLESIAPIATAVPTAPQMPASTRSPQWADPSGYIMTGKLADDIPLEAEPSATLYMSDPFMSLSTLTPGNWRRGKVPGDDEQVYFFLTADPSHVTSFSISSYAFKTPVELTDEHARGWFSQSFDEYVQMQSQTPAVNFQYDVATPVEIGTIQGSEFPMLGYAIPFTFTLEGQTLHGRYYAFFSGPHGYICTLVSLPAFWAEAQATMDQVFADIVYMP